VSIPYKSSEQKAIRAALGIDARTASNIQLEILEDAKKAVTKRHIQAISVLIKKEKITHIDAIGFHGHTIIHKPQEQYTLQIGSPQEIANKFNIKVIADFRLDDIKNKGQGAPLIPIYHKILYKDKPKPAAVINIGGVANITYIDENNLIAFDTGTGNALINDLVNQTLNIKYDKDGKIAAKGAINYNILQKFYR
jgi:anhydro-N-acetylmuramic acid kinase